MLSRIEITNFKSIAHAAVEFERENVIVGPNGSGKSNFVDALNFLRDAAVDDLDHAFTKRHGVNSVRRWSRTRPFNIGLKASFKLNGAPVGHYKLTVASAAGEYRILEEEGSWIEHRRRLDEHSRQTITNKHFFTRKPDGEIVFDVPKTPGRTHARVRMQDGELFLSQLGGSTLTQFNFWFGGLFSEVSSAGAYSIYPNKIREAQPISNAAVLADDGGNLASIIRRMRSTSQRQNREALNNALRQALPIMSEIRIESAGGFYVPVVRVKEPQGGGAHDLNMAQLSDGTLRMLGMLTAFYQPKAPRRITLEEPEQMIHPGLLSVLLEASRDYLDVGRIERQTIFTTHSPSLLDLFQPESIYYAKFVDGSTKVEPMSKRQLQVIRDDLFTAGELLIAEGISE